MKALFVAMLILTIVGNPSYAASVDCVPVAAEVTAGSNISLRVSLANATSAAPVVRLFLAEYLDSTGNSVGLDDQSGSWFPIDEQSTDENGSALFVVATEGDVSVSRTFIVMGMDDSHWYSDPLVVKAVAQ